MAQQSPPPMAMSASHFWREIVTEVETRVEAIVGFSFRIRTGTD
jgi:hypothetical protein